MELEAGSTGLVAALVAVIWMLIRLADSLLDKFLAKKSSMKGEGYSSWTSGASARAAHERILKHQHDTNDLIRVCTEIIKESLVVGSKIEKSIESLKREEGAALVSIAKINDAVIRIERRTEQIKDRQLAG